MNKTGVSCIAGGYEPLGYKLSICPLIQIFQFTNLHNQLVSGLVKISSDINNMVQLLTGKKKKGSVLCPASSLAVQTFHTLKCPSVLHFFSCNRTIPIFLRQGWRERIKFCSNLPGGSCASK